MRTIRRRLRRRPPRGARFARPPCVVFIVVCDQVNQVDPVHQVNKVDEVHQVHQVDPVHQVNEIDEVHQVNQVHEVKNRNTKEGS